MFDLKIMAYWRSINVEANIIMFGAARPDKPPHMYFVYEAEGYYIPNRKVVATWDRSIFSEEGDE